MTSPKLEHGADMLGVVKKIMFWNLDRFTYASELAATSDPTFSRSKSSTSDHATQDLSIGERPSVCHLVENLFFSKPENFTAISCAVLDLCAFNCSGGYFTPPPFST